MTVEVTVPSNIVPNDVNLSSICGRVMLEGSPAISGRTYSLSVDSYLNLITGQSEMMHHNYL